MTVAIVIVVLGAWMAEAVAIGRAMGRRGFAPYTWAALGFVLGPVAILLAAWAVRNEARGEPSLLAAGSRGEGDVDILVGLDASPASRRAVGAVEQLFAGRIGRLTFAHVLPFDATPFSEDAAHKDLEAQAAAFAHLRPTTMLLHGNPADTLRDYAVRLGYDVLAVGTRGTGRTRALLGSVASALAHGTTVPVLLADATATAAPEQRVEEEIAG